MNYLEELNDNQFLAVTTNHKKVLVIAGAGSGKTKVLSSRIRYLLENGVSPENITAFTFTNKAIEELKSRLKSYFFTNAYTFHSYCYNKIRYYYNELGFKQAPNLLDEDTIKEILKDILKSNNINMNYKYFLSYISKRKSGAIINNLTTEESILCNKVYYLLQEKLNNVNYISFDDMVPLFLNNIDNLKDKDSIYEENKYILVDECQDINNIQYQLILKLSSKYKNIFMVGDNDQMIYSFRESNIEILNDYMNKIDQKIILNQNYRSSKNILNIANNLISHNKQRLDKNLYSNIEPKAQILCTTYKSVSEEAYATILKIKHLHDNLNYDYKDIAILYRNNNQSTQIEYELKNNNIPFTTYGDKPFYNYKSVKKIISFYRLLNNLDDEISFREILLIDEYLYIKFYKEYKLQSLSIIEYGTTYSNNKINELSNKILELVKHKNEYTKSEFFDEVVNTINYSFNNNDYEKIYEFKNIILSTENSELEIINNLYLDNTNKESKGVNLLTIHKSKGLEFKCVILIGLNNGILPSELDKNIDEERRICYVAITRAKEVLYLSSSRENYFQGKRKVLNPSSFILEMKYKKNVVL